MINVYKWILIKQTTLKKYLPPELFWKQNRQLNSRLKVLARSPIVYPYELKTKWTLPECNGVEG